MILDEIRADAKAEKSRHNSCDYCSGARTLDEFCTELRQAKRILALVAVVEQSAYAMTEAERSLRAWAQPLGGMGVNIQQEDRGRAALALREITKARAALATLEAP